MSGALEAAEAYWLAAGFARWTMAGRFVPAFAEVYYKADTRHLCFGVEVSAQHCNGFEIAHGGFISTMADIWLGYNVGHLLPREARFATASLTVDFLRAVRCGDRLHGNIDRVRVGRRLHHASGAMYVGARPVASMRANFSAC